MNRAPNGDVYFVEPYALQENLTINNFAFRNYFKVPIETGDTYLDDVILSATSGHPHPSIAVPLYSKEIIVPVYSEENYNAILVGVYGPVT
jgi:hypothetical protein